MPWLMVGSRLVHNDSMTRIIREHGTPKVMDTGNLGYSGQPVVSLRTTGILGGPLYEHQSSLRWNSSFYMAFSLLFFMAGCEHAWHSMPLVSANTVSRGLSVRILMYSLPLAHSSHNDMHIWRLAPWTLIRLKRSRVIQN